MQYVTTPGAQGICPTGSHIPTDNDWKILEMQLGMTQAQANATEGRGTNQGTQLKSSGASGLNIPMTGFRVTDGTFSSPGGTLLWSSSEVDVYAWLRYLLVGYNIVYRRSTYVKDFGFSVRCLAD